MSTVIPFPQPKPKPFAVLTKVGRKRPRVVGTFSSVKEAGAALMGIAQERDGGVVWVRLVKDYATPEAGILLHVDLAKATAHARALAMN